MHAYLAVMALAALAVEYSLSLPVKVPLHESASRSHQVADGIRGPRRGAPNAENGRSNRVTAVIRDKGKEREDIAGEQRRNLPHTRKASSSDHYALYAPLRIEQEHLSESITSRPAQDQPSLPSSSTSQKQTKGKQVINEAISPKARSLFEDAGNYIGTRDPATVARRQAFERVWNKLKLHTKMAPTELADKVAGMGLHGIHPKSSAIFAGVLVSRKTDKDYQTKYYARTKQIAERLSYDMRSLRKDSYYSNLPATKQMEIGLQTTLETLNAPNNKKKLDARAKAVALKPKSKAASNVRKVGNLLLEHLERKELNFDQIPLKNLLQEAEQVKDPTMTPMHFTKSLYRYFELNREGAAGELRGIKRLRKNEKNKEYKRARIEQKRQEQQQQQE